MQVLSPAGFEFNTIELPIAHLPAGLEGFRILHLTDVHLNRLWFEAYDRLIEQVNDRRPDVICFTGDLVDNRWDPTSALANAERLARGLRGRLGTFAVIGNHDGDLLAPYVVDFGWTLLHPGIARIEVNGATLEIVGLPCVSRLDVTPRLMRRLPPREPAVTRVVLSHYPDSIHQIGDLRPEVILTGHTHGGQCCLPGGFPILTHDSLPRRMAKGVFRIGDSWLVVSRGFGFATWPIRVFCPGEVCEIVLRTANEPEA